MRNLEDNYAIDDGDLNPNLADDIAQEILETEFNAEDDKPLTKLLLKKNLMPLGSSSIPKDDNSTLIPDESSSTVTCIPGVNK